jgi:ABC-type nitrate/sulfonate/bicarbonate transport system substrate-binding protein
MTRSKLAALFVTIGMLAIACGGTAAPSAAPATSAASAATAAPATLPAPELTTVRIGLSAPNEPVQFAEKLADILGYYKENGITTVNITGFEGDGKALQALVAGQLDFFVGGSSTAISSQLTDTPLKVISMNSVLNTDGIYCKAAIKTAADVKGKSIAISTFGGTSHGSVLIALQQLGLTPKDVVIREVGNEGTRIAALKAGSVDCADVSLQQDQAMKDAGLNQVADVTKGGGQWGRSGLMTRTDFLAKNPNTVLDVVAAVVRAQNYMFANNNDAVKPFADFTQMKTADAQLAMSQFPSYGLRNMVPTVEAFKAPQQTLGSINAPVLGVDLTKCFDSSILQKLIDNGFYAKYGIPTK